MDDKCAVYGRPCAVRRPPCATYHFFHIYRLHSGGLPGALIITAGIFLPAFVFTLVGYKYLETLVNHKALQTFLGGVTAGVVGLIATTAIGLLHTTITGLPALGIFVAAGFMLYWWKAKVARCNRYGVRRGIGTPAVSVTNNKHTRGKIGKGSN